MNRFTALLVAAAAVLTVGALTPPAFAATTPVPGASPSAAATPSGGLTASVTYGSGGPGKIVTVTGSGWPSRVTIQASTCGNDALKGATDCSQQGAGSTVSNPDGTFSIDLPVGKPPKPCPCVIHVVSPDTTGVVNLPFVVTGQPSAPLDQRTEIRTVDASSRLTGAGPLSAWLGGTAKRTFVLTVKNTGTTTLTNPGVTITAGKGGDPSDLLAAPPIGTILPNQTIEYRLPVSFAAPAVGQYTVKATFTDLNTQVTTVAKTSTYPWVLIVLAWLLLQPLLLGLYKRRPVAEAGPEDPFAPSPGPVLGGPAPVPVFAAGPMPVGAGAAYAAAAGSQAAPVGAAAVGAVAGTAVARHVPSPLLTNYNPVFGVGDLRAYIDPAATGAAPTVAPRVVLGGIVPAAVAVNGAAEQAAIPPPYEPPADHAPPAYEPPQPQYAEPQYAQPQYAEPQYAQPQYAEPQYAQPQYAEPQYAQPQYAEPQYAQPQYAEPQYAQPQYAEPQYAQPQYAEPQYAQPQYAEPQYAQPAYAEPQYAQPQYAEPQYAQPGYEQQAYVPATPEPEAWAQEPPPYQPPAEEPPAYPPPPPPYQG